MMDMRNNFYCQKKCGDANFSIDEWNKAHAELKTMTPEQQEFVLQAETICQTQCSSCAKIVAETRIKNKLKYEKSKM